MASRSALVGAALAAGALFLSGCGGGGGGGKPKQCTNDQFQLKTQSYSADMTLTGSTTVGDAPAVSTTASGTMSQALDFDSLDIYEDLTMSMTVDGKKVNEDVKAYLSVTKKQLAFSVDVSIDGTDSVKNCSYVDLSSEPIFNDKAKLKQEIDTVITLLAGFMKCTENDGTYDTFVLDQKFPPENLPVPLPKPLDGTTGNIKVTNKLTTDFMLHSVSSQTTIDKPKVNNTPALKSSQDIELKVKGDAAKPNGPTSDELDYKTWGVTCTEQKIPPHSLKMLFETSRSQALNDMFPGVEVKFPDSPAGLLLTAIDQIQTQSESVSTVAV